MTQSDCPYTPGPCVMWLDPGKTTGWAKYSDERETFASGEADFLETGEILAYHAKMRGFRIGWERFDITPATYRLSQAGWPLEVIGMAKWVCRERDNLLPALRSARNVAPEGMLKAAGWHKPGLGHANDAARHLLAWYMRHGTSPASVSDKISSYLISME